MYSKKVENYFKKPINMGVIEKPDGIGITENEICSDIIKMYIKVNKKNIIEEAKFQAKGCPPVIASCCIVTENIKNMNMKDAICIDENFVIEKLDGLPKEKEHCAKLVINTLQKAIKNVEWNSL